MSNKLQSTEAHTVLRRDLISQITWKHPCGWSADPQFLPDLYKLGRFCVMAGSMTRSTLLGTWMKTAGGIVSPLCCMKQDGFLFWSLPIMARHSTEMDRGFQVQLWLVLMFHYVVEVHGYMKYIWSQCVLTVHTGKLDSRFKAMIVNSTKWQYYGTPNVGGLLHLTWNSSLVRAEKVHLELWGYRETGEWGLCLMFTHFYVILCICYKHLLLLYCRRAIHRILASQMGVLVLTRKGLSKQWFLQFSAHTSWRLVLKLGAWRCTCQSEHLHWWQVVRDTIPLSIDITFIRSTDFLSRRDWTET